MTVSMPIGKLLRRENLHIDYLPGCEKVTGSNPEGIAVKQYTNDPDVAVVVREGDAVAHSHVRETLSANGFQLWVEDDKVLIKAKYTSGSVNAEAWKWADE